MLYLGEHLILGFSTINATLLDLLMHDIGKGDRILIFVMVLFIQKETLLVCSKLLFSAEVYT